MFGGVIGCVTYWELPGGPPGLSMGDEALGTDSGSHLLFADPDRSFIQRCGFPPSEMGVITLAWGMGELNEANREAWGLSPSGTPALRNLAAL